MADVAVITGGASGFGLALAERCAAHGMDVALLDLDGERAERGGAVAGRGARRRGVRAAASTSATPRASTAAAAAVDERFGRADLVVSNVGVQLFGAVERFTDDEWRWVLDVNVIGSARVARAFLPLLRAHERPRSRSRRRRRCSTRRAGSAPTRRASSRCGAWPRRCGSSSPTTASACR